MVKDNFSSQLEGLPFDSIIGAPLKSAVDAQNKAAETLLNYIRDGGLQADTIPEEKSSPEVTFKFNKDDRVIEQKVPLLTIVPIPYIAIDNVDVNFKADVNFTVTNESDKD